MSSKFSSHLVAFLLLISGSLTAATIVDSPPVYQKPSSMAAMDWIQHLEDERDQADIAGDYAGFKAITDEISATIAGKHGFSEERATPEEELFIIHSITRTRHRFMGQRHMLHDRYLGYDRAQTNALLQTDARFKDHMAAVLAIDAMVMKALNDDNFSDDWSDTEKDPQELIPGIIAHAQKHEKKEVFDPLRPAFQHFLQTRRDTLRLVNDVFSVFAPKMTLLKVHNEAMELGKTYKGWTVHNNATEVEKERVIDKVEGLSIIDEGGDVFSSSARATPPSDELRARLGLNLEAMIVEYVYDPYLLKEAFDLSGAGPKRFYLSRPLNPQLARILTRPHGIIPVSAIVKTYKNVTTTTILPESPPLEMIEMIETAVKRGTPSVLSNYACMLFNGSHGVPKDIPRAIKLCREAADLGDRTANQYSLPLMIAQVGGSR